jgi:lysophospholipid acyltransferase (LPLAT)-like uncharacterized protein
MRLTPQQAKLITKLENGYRFFLSADGNRAYGISPQDSFIYFAARTLRSLVRTGVVTKRAGRPGFSDTYVLKESL